MLDTELNNVWIWRRIRCIPSLSCNTQSVRGGKIWTWIPKYMRQYSGINSIKVLKREAIQTWEKKPSFLGVVIREERIHESTNTSLVFERLCKLEMATKSFHKGKIKCSEGKSNKEQCIFVNWWLVWLGKGV